MDIPIIVVSAVIALLAFIGKRWLDRLDQDIKELKQAQVTEQIDRAKITVMLDGCKSGLNEMREDIKDIKESL